MLIHLLLLVEIDPQRWQHLIFWREKRLQSGVGRVCRAEPRSPIGYHWGMECFPPLNLLYPSSNSSAQCNSTPEPDTTTLATQIPSSHCSSNFANWRKSTEISTDGSIHSTRIVSYAKIAKSFHMFANGRRWTTSQQCGEIQNCTGERESIGNGGVGRWDDDDERGWEVVLKTVFCVLSAGSVVSVARSRISVF